MTTEKETMPEFRMREVPVAIMRCPICKSEDIVTYFEGPDMYEKCNSCGHNKLVGTTTYTGSENTPERVLPTVKPGAYFGEEEETKEKLTMKQEEFCQIYSADSSCFGNGVASYLEVYDVDREKPNWYRTACSAASELLTLPKVYHRINDLLEEQGLNDAFVDKQLLFLISQHHEVGTKLGAIKEYNALKKRITQKIETENKTTLMSDPETVAQAMAQLKGMMK